MSLDSFHYFGTADSYLLDLLPRLRPGGQLGVARDAAMLRTDGGRLFCFTRVVAREQ